MEGDMGKTQLAAPLNVLAEKGLKKDFKQFFSIILTNRDSSDSFYTEKAVASLLQIMKKRTSEHQVQAKFNLVGFGTDFDMQVVEMLNKMGTEPGICVSNEEACRAFDDPGNLKPSVYLNEYLTLNAHDMKHGKVVVLPNTPDVI